MERKNASRGEFEAAIKNFSKISLEVDSLINLGNADAHKIMNKSFENRSEAIAQEASRRLTSFEAERKGTKSKESLQTFGTLEKLLKEEVEMEFDKGVEEQKTLLRGNSVVYEDNTEANNTNEIENKKSESADEESAEDEESEEDESENEETEDLEDDSESSEEEDDDDESADTTDKDEDEEENSTENESTDDEKTVEEVAADKISGSSKT